MPTRLVAAPHLRPKSKVRFATVAGRNLDVAFASVNDVRVVKVTDAIFHLILKSARDIITAKERASFAIDNEAFAIATPWHELEDHGSVAQECTDEQWLIAQCCMRGTKGLYVPELNVFINNC